MLGTIPMLLPLAVVSVAVLEGAYAGAGFGMAVGLLWELAYPGGFGGLVFGMALAGMVTGAVSQYALSQSFLSCLLCSAGVLGVLDGLRILRILFLQVETLDVLLQMAVPEVVLSLCWTPVVYLDLPPDLPAGGRNQSWPEAGGARRKGDDGTFESQAVSQPDLGRGAGAGPVAHLFVLQPVQHPVYQRAGLRRPGGGPVAENETVPASRGLILDRNGKVLVSNEISYQVTLDMGRMGRAGGALRQSALPDPGGPGGGGDLGGHPAHLASPPSPIPRRSAPSTPPPPMKRGRQWYQMTRLGRLAVYMGWIEDPRGAGGGRSQKQDPAGQEEPGLWDRLHDPGGPPGGRSPGGAPALSPAHRRGAAGRDVQGPGIKGQGAVDEKAAKAAGETVPTLNLGDMDPGDARAVAGVLYELYYRSRIADWPPYYFAEDVDVDFITRVKELNLRGWRSRPPRCASMRRSTPPTCWATLAPSTQTTWPTYKEKGGYTMNDKVGVAGAESAFESYLKGTSGTGAIERNENGKIISSQWLTDEETGESLAPQPGSNVFLTIDMGLQQKVEDTLAARVPGLSDTVEGAACVVEDVRTGEILASASYPTYSLPTFGRTTTACWTTPEAP